MLRILVGIGLSIALAGSALADPALSSKKNKLAKLQEAVTNAQKAYEAKDWPTVILITDGIIAASGERLPDQMALPIHQMRAAALVSKQPKDCKAALPSLEKITELAPNDHQYFGLKGICQSELKMGDHGVEAFSTAIKLAPEPQFSWYQGRCIVFYQTERFPEALDDCTKASMLNQTEYQPFAIIGSVQNKLGHQQEALDAWESALAAKPTDEMAKKNVAQLKKILKKP